MIFPRLPASLVGALLAAALAVPAHAKNTGLIFVSSENDNPVAVLDGKTHQVIKTVATGKRPRDMRLSPDGSALFVIASNSNRVDVIDIAQLKVSSPAPGPCRASPSRPACRRCRATPCIPAACSTRSPGKCSGLVC